MKKLNSPKMFFIFMLLVIVAIIVIHFVFRSIRVIFDMDKKEAIKMNDAKISSNNTIVSKLNYSN